MAGPSLTELLYAAQAVEVRKSVREGSAPPASLVTKRFRGRDFIDDVALIAKQRNIPGVTVASLIGITSEQWKELRLGRRKLQTSEAFRLGELFGVNLYDYWGFNTSVTQK